MGNNDKLQIAGKPVMERYYLVNAQNKERDNCIILLMSQVGNSLHADVGQDGCLQVHSHSLMGGKTMLYLIDRPGEAGCWNLDLDPASLPVRWYLY